MREKRYLYGLYMALQPLRCLINYLWCSRLQVIKFACSGKFWQEAISRFRDFASTRVERARAINRKNYTAQIKFVEDIIIVLSCMCVCVRARVWCTEPGIGLEISPLFSLRVPHRFSMYNHACSIKKYDKIIKISC